MSTTKASIGLATAAAAATLLLSALAAAAPADIRLPPETAQLHASPLAGYAIASQKCGICHSADYVDYQPPNLTVTQWTGEMTKMQKAYGAPLSDEDVKLLGIYLAATYGDAKTVSEADRALQPGMIAAAASATTAASASPASSTTVPPGVQSLLTANGCLACHAIDKPVVGPSYRDVAARYKADPQALARVSSSIHDGGSGRWGTVPMPPFANLGADDAKALAGYVLAQGS